MREIHSRDRNRAMNRNTSRHLSRLAVCVLSGVISCVALFELLLMLDVVSAYDIQPAKRFELGESIVVNATEMGRRRSSFARANFGLRFENDDGFLLAQKVICHAQARNAASDDADIATQIVVQSTTVRGQIGGCSPQW